VKKILEHDPLPHLLAASHGPRPTPLTISSAPNATLQRHPHPQPRLGLVPPGHERASSALRRSPRLTAAAGEEATSGHQGSDGHLQGLAGTPRISRRSREIAPPLVAVGVTRSSPPARWVTPGSVASSLFHLALQAGDARATKDLVGEQFSRSDLFLQQQQLDHLVFWSLCL